MRQQGLNATERLPEPDADAQAHAERVAAVLRGQIERAGGALPFHRFMETALYAPELGYYVAGSRKLGADGDFVTAPEISPLFGRCLARQCAQVLEVLEGGDILEFGAGTGSLAREILEQLARLRRLPTRYLILETSPELRRRQQQVFAQADADIRARVHWLDGLPSAFEGVMIANEVLDAMPVHRFAVQDGQPREVCVRSAAAGFEECLAAPSDTALPEAVQRLRDAGLSFGEGYRSEINLRAGPWIGALGQGLRRGAVLLIDYGYPRHEYYRPERHMGTLMCHYRHRAHTDPYRWVGLQDITAYVDFTAVAEAGLEAGLELAGYATQAHFLLGCGMEQLLAESDPARTVEHFNLISGAKQLILPGEMGERFQVLGLVRDLPQPQPLMGFSLRDLRERL